MAITRLSGGTTPANGSDPRTFPTIWNAAADDIEAAEAAISAIEANDWVTTARIDDGAVTAPKLATTAGAVMVFANAAARTAAIPTPAEGMATYLNDQNILSLYDGSAWKNSLGVTGGIIDVKSATKTNTQTASISAGSTLAVTDLNITHACASTANKVVLIAQITGTQGSAEYNLNAGLTVAGSLIGIGDAAGSRTRVGASNGNRGTSPTPYANSVSLVAEYSPASISSITYGVSLINADASTRTLFVNRSEDDFDNAYHIRGASSLILMEVAG